MGFIETSKWCVWPFLFLIESQHHYEWNCHIYIICTETRGKDHSDITVISPWYHYGDIIPARNNRGFHVQLANSYYFHAFKSHIKAKQSPHFKANQRPGYREEIQRKMFSHKHILLKSITQVNTELDDILKRNLSWHVGSHVGCVVDCEFKYKSSRTFKMHPKHSHLRFFTTTSQVLSCYRGFRTWFVDGDWEASRRRGVVTEYTQLRQHIATCLCDCRLHGQPICEVLMD